MNKIFETEKIKTILPKIKEFVKTHLYPLETFENLNGKFTAIEPILFYKGINNKLIKQIIFNLFLLIFSCFYLQELNSI